MRSLPYPVYQYHKGRRISCGRKKSGTRQERPGSATDPVMQKRPCTPLEPPKSNPTSTGSSAGTQPKSLPKSRPKASISSSPPRPTTSAMPTPRTPMTTRTNGTSISQPSTGSGRSASVCSKPGGRIAVNVQPLFSDYVPTHHIISNQLAGLGSPLEGGIFVGEEQLPTPKYTGVGELEIAVDAPTSSTHGNMSRSSTRAPTRRPGGAMTSISPLTSSRNG